MRENLSRALTVIFGHEGGFTNRRDDTGNWTGGAVGEGILKGTKYGIAAKAYPHLDIANLTLEQAADIYRRDYWSVIRGDDLPSGVDLCVFDAAVNSGPVRAIRWLQAAVGVQQDGIIGLATMDALSARDAREVIQTICDIRLAFMQQARGRNADGTTYPLWPIYGKGWSKRVDHIEKTSIEWAASVPVVTTPPQPPQPKGLFACVRKWMQSRKT